MTVRTACSTLLICSGLVSGAFAQGKAVDVTAADGAKLKATYYSPGKPGPGVILFHQCNMDRAAWTTLAEALQARGIHSLAPDYRGMGENSGLPNDYGKRATDADAALAALAAMPGVDATRIAAGGASCGVDAAVQLARRSNRIKALVLLSGGTSDAGLRYLETSGPPTFFAFSADEGGPLPAMKNAVAASKTEAATIRELQHAGHGVPMFTAEPTLLPELAGWLARVLR